MLRQIRGFAVLALFLISQVHGLNFVARAKWSRRPLASKLNQLPNQISRVIIAHTVTEECFSENSCEETVRLIQDYHVKDLGFSDIGYNFLLGGDGTIFEGRGWTTEGSHTFGYNKDSIGVAFIGNFNSKVPTPKQLKAAELILEEGVAHNYLIQDYRVFGQRQLIATNSPGNVLFSKIKKWPHWSNSY